MIFVIDLPVTIFTSGIPYWSRKIVPIWAELYFCLANFSTNSSTSFALYFNHFGTNLYGGLLEPALPLCLLYILAIQAPLNSLINQITTRITVKTKDIKLPNIAKIAGIPFGENADVPIPIASIAAPIKIKMIE